MAKKVNVHPAVKYTLIALVAIAAIGFYMYDRVTQTGEITTLDIIAAVFTVAIYSVVLTLMVSRRIGVGPTNKESSEGESDKSYEEKKKSGEYKNQLSERDINKLMQ
jgi:hypothetical protein